MVHHLMIIGEACRALSAEFRQSHPEVPWVEIVRMRNVLVHQYFVVDRDVVWRAVERDIPALKAQLERITGA
jgi:uncharacterized protein with HEPN domain